MNMILEIGIEISYDLIHEIKRDAFAKPDWQKTVDYCDRLIGFFDEYPYMAFRVYSHIMKKIDKLKTNKSMENFLENILSSRVIFRSGRWVPYPFMISLDNMETYTIPIKHYETYKVVISEIEKHDY